MAGDNPFSDVWNRGGGWQLGFGESALTSTNFDGPGGSTPLSPAVPFWRQPRRRLKKGDLVFVDVAFAMEGYHTDRRGCTALARRPWKKR